MDFQWKILRYSLFFVKMEATGSPYESTFGKSWIKRTILGFDVIVSNLV